MKVRAAFVSLVMLLGAPTASADCLEYELGEVSLSGTLVKRTFAGPPNYESIALGDAAEHVLLLVLLSPVCIEGDPGAEANSSAFQGIREIQLVLDESIPAELLGRTISVRGRLFEAISGHHHTRILLTVAELHAARQGAADR